MLWILYDNPRAWQCVARHDLLIALTTSWEFLVMNVAGSHFLSPPTTTVSSWLARTGFDVVVKDPSVFAFVHSLTPATT